MTTIIYVALASLLAYSVGNHNYGAATLFGLLLFPFLLVLVAEAVALANLETITRPQESDLDAF